MSPGKRKGPEGTGPDANTTEPAPTGYPFLGHESHLLLLSSRIAWLEGHEHWWLRTPAGRRQLSYIRRERAA
jgi:hypothetical protein